MSKVSSLRPRLSWQSAASITSCTSPRFLSKLTAVSTVLFTLIVGMEAAESLSERSLASIRSIQDEKAARSPAHRKLDSQLVYAIKGRRSVVAMGVAPTLKPRLDYQADGRLLVDVRGEVTPALVDQIQQQGGTIVRALPPANWIRAQLSIDAIDALASNPGVRSIRPADQATTYSGSLDSQGDVTHAAAQVRSALQIDGAGVKIGVLSDSVDFLNEVQATGDLPPIQILPGQAGAGSGEGTAMLEIIHDLAPGAQLYFASAFDGMESFAQNIRDLAAAGCKIIVDDVGYFRESPFQEDVISQAVADVSAAGTLYFAAAGNSGNKDGGTSGTWEGDFVDGGVSSLGRGGRVHSFGTVTANAMLSGGGSRRADLFWSDPLGQSANDYDLYVVDANGTVVASSTNIQDGNDDPYESVGRVNVGEKIVIVKYSGQPRFLHLATGRGLLAVSTGGAVRGHNASPATNAFSVAATWVGASPTEFTAGSVNQVERFSSDGPRRVFFLRDGTPITAGNLSSTGGQVFIKPDITAADGVAVATPGFAPFFGTSAAAPHAAAVAALLWSYNPSISPSALRSALLSTALDIGPTGVDSTAGYGIVMPERALGALEQPTARLALTSTLVLDAGGDGRLQANECADLYVSLRNLLSVAGTSATGIVATLSSLTPGVLVDPAPRSFDEIAPQHSGTNATAFRISSDNSLPCDRPVNLQLSVSSANGPSWTFPINIDTVASPSGAPVVFNAPGLPVPIPDWDEIFSPLLVSGLTKPVAEVVVSLHLTHTYDADLGLDLIGPDGTTVTLSEYVGGSDDNYGVDCSRRTRFSDSAASIIGSSPAPFEGAFKPKQSLIAFRGKVGSSANGIWQLHLHDDAPLDDGTLLCWSLEVKEVECESGSGSCLIPPSLVSSPTAQTNLVGTTAQFAVTAAGTEPLSYQWSRNGTPIPGATLPTLVIPSVVDDSSGLFTVRVTNPYGVVDSSPVALMVTHPPVVLSGPVDVSVAAGNPAQFQVTVGGTGPFAFQWYHDSNPVVGETNATILFSSAIGAQSGAYFVQVSTPYGTTNSPSAALTVIVPPSIVGTPTSQVVTNGDHVVFSILANGSAPLSYFWFFNQTTYLGAGVNGVLDLGEVVINQAGLYSVIVSNQAGVVSSSPVSLDVLAAPFFVLSPTNREVARGGSLILPSVAIGSPSPSYQWYRADVASTNGIESGTNANLSISPLTFGDSAFYFAVASNVLGMATSAVAQVTVLDLPLIVQQPHALEIVAGTTAHFTVQATGVGPFTYQWFFNSTQIPSATSSSLDIPAVTAGNEGDYRVRVANGIGGVESDLVHLRVITSPVISQQPNPVVAPVGGVASFEVIALGSAPLTYQWLFNSTNRLTDATNATLTLSNLSVALNGGYSLAVSNAAGSVTSVVASLSVLLPPSVIVSPADLPAAVDSTATLTSTVLGAPPLSYQWFKNGSELLNGATGPTLTLAHLALSDSGSYELQVSNAVGVARSIPTTVRVLLPPTIVTHPADFLAAIGGQAHFSVVASGSPILKYQWFFNSAPIPDATNATLILENIQGADEGSYAVSVENEVGSVIADKAGLQVLSPPTIAFAPNGGVVEVGETIHLSVLALGSPTLTYQWYFNTNQPIPGATEAVLDITKAQHEQSGFYSVTVGNPVGSVSSVPVLVRVIDRPMIVQEPADIAIPRGSRSNLVVSVTGGAPLVYQWYFETAPIDSGTNAALPLINVSSTQAGHYQVVASNDIGSVTSRIAIVTIKEIPTILQAPLPLTVTAGDPASFTVVAEGAVVGGPLRYQWWFNGIFSLPDQTNASLHLVNVQPNAAGSYSVEVINNEGSVFSSPVLLSVLFPPSITTQPLDITVARGSTSSLSVSALGTPPIRYQWYQNETQLIVDATNALLTLDSSLTQQSALFSVVLENSVGSVTSRLAQVTVLDPPTFLHPLASQRVVLGGTALFQADAAGSPPFAYQWYRENGSPIPGATGPTLSIPNVQVSSEGGYRVQVSNLVGTNFSNSAQLVAVVPPEIVVQPSDLLGAAGGTASLSIEATGTDPLHYQWYFFETNMIPFGTNATLTLTSLDVTNTGDYACLVSNEAGSVLSKSGFLTVLFPPTISLQPSDEVAVAGSLVHFEAKANGTEPFSFQWYFNTNQTLLGQTSATLEFTALPEKAGGYSLVVSNAVGSVTSVVARLDVILPASISQQPVDQVVATGSDVAVSVVASGSSPITYQWFFNASTPIPNATNATLLLTGVGAGQSGRYSVTVANAGGSETSKEAIITVLDPPTFVVPPSPLSVVRGQTANFTATATGAGPLAYQWFRDISGAISGANAPGLQLTSVQAGDSGLYFLVVANAVGSVTSAPVALTVILPPVIDIPPADITVAKGTTLILPAKASGSEPLSYQWFFFGTNAIAGATNDTLTLSSIDFTNAGPYSLFVSNAAGVVLSPEAQVTVLNLPGILAGPDPISVPLGQLAHFQVQAVGALPLTYTWLFQETNILATGSSPAFDIPHVSALDAGFYSVLISNLVGSVTSAPVRLDVILPPVVVIPPQNQKVILGQSVSFSATLSGTDPFGYQWFKNGTTLLPDATNAVLEIASAALTDAGNYAVQVSNAAGTVLSAAATLEVLELPTISSQPSSLTVSNGALAAMTVGVAGSPPFTYQWYTDGGIELTGETGSTLSFSPATPAKAGLYYVKVSNPVGVITSLPAELRVLDVPLFTVQPLDVTAASGTSVILTAVVTGSPQLHFQWVRNGTVPVPDGTNSLLTLSNAQTADSGVYRLSVTNEVGVALSRQVTVTILDAPQIVTQPDSVTASLGDTITLSVVATGSDLHYQWVLDGPVAIPGATSASLSLPNVGLSDAANYSVIVSNAVGVVTSTPAIVRILVAAEVESFAYSADTVAVSFHSVSGLRYTLESTDLVTPPSWVQSPGSIRRKGTGEVMTLLDTVTDVPRRFYRIRVE